MKYEQPFGITDADASYINGNPDTGTMGSIPSAASIENPQREIVNLIKDVGAVTPNASDLHQLGKSVQTGRLNFGVDVGVVNAMIVPLVPVPDAYYGGMEVRFKAKFAPTAATTLDAGRGARSVVKSGGAILKGSEWSIGDIIQVTFEATSQQWQLPPSPIAMLYGPRDYYVSTAGLDTNDGLTINTPFKTLQKAQNMTQLYNLNGYDITIHVADGSYAAVACGAVNGSGTIHYVGNPANPTACQVTNTAGSAFLMSGFGAYTTDGFSVAASGGTNGTANNGVWVVKATVTIYNMEWRTCTDFHIGADAAAYIGYVGPISRIVGSAGQAHMASFNSSYIQCNWAPVTVQIDVRAPVSFPGGFCSVANGGNIYGRIVQPVLNPGNVTGPRYYVTGNGVLSTAAGGANYYPGTTAGVTATGGQYT